MIRAGSGWNVTRLPATFGKRNQSMLLRIFALFSAVFTARGCSTSRRESLPSDQPGSFAITEVESKETPEGTQKAWRATSREGGEPFAFRLEMLLKVPSGKLPVAFSMGAIIREQAADGTRFLRDVARGIAAQSEVPTNTERHDRLDFSTAILGTSLSREAGDQLIGGKFSSSKPGNWMAFKLYLADGEGEVYLNLDPVSGQGEFTTKDPEYGEVVLRELAHVFLP